MCVCVRHGLLADSAAMHDPSLSHNRPLTQVLIPHGSVCVCVCDAQCGPYSAAREVVTFGVLNFVIGPWQLYGGFQYANTNYN